MKMLMILIFKLLPKFITDKIQIKPEFENPDIIPNVTNMLICMENCGTCPSAPDDAGLNCTLGKSSLKVKENGCNCFKCPLIDKCGSNMGYFCKNGISLKSENSSDSSDPYLERFISSEDPVIDSKIVDDGVFSEEVVDVHLNFEPIEGENISVKTDSNTTILESSVKAGNEHVHACGGNGKCSTCRVLVTEGLENLNPRNSAEQEMADFKGFSNNIRLACQTTGTGDIKLRRLVLDESDIEEAVSEGKTSIGAIGRDVEVAVLFSDIRSFTSFSEKSLPYDLVHILNRYFNALGAKIDQNGGYIDKYMGDGIMAIFGLENGSDEDPAFLALKSSFEMIEALKEFNVYLKKNFDHEFEIGIGIHYGKVVVGSLGYHKKLSFTAIGDTVNTASRIESLNQEMKSEILVSESVYNRVKDKFSWKRDLEASVKGKEKPVKVYEPIGQN